MAEDYKVTEDETWKNLENFDATSDFMDKYSLNENDLTTIVECAKIIYTQVVSLLLQMVLIVSKMYGILDLTLEFMKEARYTLFLTGISTGISSTTKMDMHGLFLMIL